MARIPGDEIERLKRDVSLERLVKAAGIELRRHGADLPGLCPFHDDREPSLVITPDKNLWHCLGACQTGGSVIDWVMRTKGVSFRHAVELLKADHPALAAPVERIVRKDTASKLDAPISADAADREVSRHAEAVAGSTAVSRKPRAYSSGDGGPIQTRLCEPHGGSERHSGAGVDADGVEPD